MRPVLALRAFCVLTFLVACGSDDPAAPTTEPPAPPPDTPAFGAASVTFAPGVLRTKRAQALPATVTIERGGREGEATIEVLDLPVGVTADPATIPASESSTNVVVRTTDAAPLGGPRPFRVRATIAGESVETSGRLVVAGAAGTPDTSFGQGGVLTVRVAPDLMYERPEGVAIGPDGEIYVRGLAYTSNPTVVVDPFVLRLLPGDGALDPSFGGGGKVRGLDGALAEAHYRSMAPAAGGLFTLLCYIGGCDVRRFDAKGALDAAFGGGGRVALPGGVGDSGSYDLAARPAGGVFAGDGSAILALDPSGVTDTTFQSVALEGSKAFAIDAAGRILTCPFTLGEIVVRRFLPSGAVDTTFGQGGTATFPLPAPAGAPHCSTIVPRSDGSIVVGGDWAPSGVGDTAGVLVGLRADGTLDPAFGEAGFRVHTTPSRFHGIRPTPDGGIVVNGGTFLRRYTATGAPDTTFGDAGELPDLELETVFEGTIAVDHVAGRVLVAGTPEPDSSVRVRRYWL